MRLGQLARKLDKKPHEIVTFLETTHQILIEDNLNTKLEAEALDLVMAEFKPEVIPEPVEDAPVAKVVVEEIAEEVIAAIEPEVVEEVEEEAEPSEEEIEANTLESIAEEVFDEKAEPEAPEVEVKSENVEESNVVEKSEEDEDVITEVDIAARIKDGVIKAPKEELEGPTVVGKIELPVTKRSVEFIVSRDTESVDVTEEIYEKRKADKAAKRERYLEAKKNKKKNTKPKKQRRVLTDADKRAHQAKIDAKKRTQQEHKKKESKKSHYVENIQKKQSANQHKRKKKEIEKSLKKQTPKDNRPEPTTKWGKFVRWLNT